RDDSSEGLQSYAVSGKGRVARSQEGWSLRRIAKAIGTAALYASGQALSGTQQAMVEFSGQSGSGVAPFLVGTTVLTLPSYVGGQPLNLGGDQGILHPSTYGEDQATPVSPVPALRGTLPPTVPTTVTIDEEGELECSLDGITHSSTDGDTTILLEMETGIITKEEREQLQEFAQEYQTALRTRKGEITRYINIHFSEEAKAAWPRFCRGKAGHLMNGGAGRGADGELDEEDSTVGGSDGAGAGGAAAGTADRDEDGAGDNEGMEEEEEADHRGVGAAGAGAVSSRISPVTSQYLTILFNKYIRQRDELGDTSDAENALERYLSKRFSLKSTEPTTRATIEDKIARLRECMKDEETFLAMTEEIGLYEEIRGKVEDVFTRYAGEADNLALRIRDDHVHSKREWGALAYWKGTTAFCIGDLKVPEPALFHPDRRIHLNRETLLYRHAKKGSTNFAMASVRLIGATEPRIMEEWDISPIGRGPAIFKSGWWQDGEYFAIDNNREHLGTTSPEILKYLTFVQSRSSLFFNGDVDRLPLVGWRDLNDRSSTYYLAERSIDERLGGTCINPAYAAKYVALSRSGEAFFHTEQAVVTLLEEDSRHCLTAVQQTEDAAGDASKQPRSSDRTTTSTAALTKPCLLREAIGARLEDLKSRDVIFNLNILSYLTMCDKCAATLFREGESGKLFLDRYRRALGFRTLRLIVTMDAIENQGSNGHISFGKWKPEIDDVWVVKYIDSTLINDIATGGVTYFQCSESEESDATRSLPNYALKDGPWIVHRFVKPRGITQRFNENTQTVGACPYYHGAAAAGK
ncbi:MAG: hypothetical protein Q8Q56_03070, partial [Alphaproteobacteria bacterium]|nr:hypothetical protein [Alphaproteobacteria bacterium]